jgi:hypothetical protein
MEYHVALFLNSLGCYGAAHCWVAKKKGKNKKARAASYLFYSSKG